LRFDVLRKLVGGEFKVFDSSLHLSLFSLELSSSLECSIFKLKNYLFLSLNLSLLSLNLVFQFSESVLEILEVEISVDLMSLVNDLLFLSLEKRFDLVDNLILSSHKGFNLFKD